MFVEKTSPSPQGMPPTSSIENLTSMALLCRRKKRLVYALKTQISVRDIGLEAHKVLANRLIHMLIDCGSMYHARDTFDRLIYRDEFSWVSIILGYADSEDPQTALALYDRMKEGEFISPSSYMYVALINSCTLLNNIEKGTEIHNEINKLGFHSDIYVGNALVFMYIKCKLVAKACDLFEKLPLRDVISWTALISGYTDQGHGEEALQCFEKMKIEGVLPNDVTYICCLKACGCIGAHDTGHALHGHIVRKGLLESNIVVGNTLVDMYAKCAFLTEAQKVFDVLPLRNVVSWNVLMTGYIKYGCNIEAIDCFEQMQKEGFPQNAATFICGLKACGSIGVKVKGQEMHCEIVKKGIMEKDITVGNALVDMYGNCDLLAEAQKVFDKLPDHDVVSWTTLIAWYVKRGHGKEAVECFKTMKVKGVSPNVITFICIMQACGNMRSKEMAECIDAEIARKGFFETDATIGNALVDMYAKCGLVEKAQDVFYKLPLRDNVSWNALITGYADEGQAEEALYVFRQMETENISPDSVTFVSCLKACGEIGTIENTIGIHAEITRRGFFESDVSLGNALVDTYCKCDLLAKAQEVFDKLPRRDVVSWNVLISGYTKHGCGYEALNQFQYMQRLGVPPDAVTFACILKACGIVRAWGKGYEIQQEITRKGLFDTDSTLGNAVVDMYVGFGLLKEAEDMFDRLLVRNVLSWTSIISGYSSYGYGEMSLKHLKRMQEEGIAPDAITLASALKACGNIGACDQGQTLYEEISRSCLLERDVVVGNAVVDMYANCGFLTHAQEVFDELPTQDLVSWNALIAGYAQLGESENAFSVLRNMIKRNQRPNMVTFVSILTACSHAGSVEEGHICIKFMSLYSLIPTCKHYICMIDILSRAGQLRNAIGIIKEMPFHPNLVTWNTILGACQRWDEIELGVIENCCE